MKIILNKDVENLGDEGDVKVVKDGYARNYLIPQSLAVPFSAHTLHIFEQKKAKIALRKEAKRKSALDLRDKLVNVEIVLSMPAGDNGKLFGAVTGNMIVEALAAQELIVEKRMVSIPGNSLKALGTHEVKIKILDKDVVPLKVTINQVS